jgi:hypothetical protein
MKWGAWLGILGTLIVVSLGGGAPLTTRKPVRMAVEPFDRVSTIEPFEGQKRACAIVIGDGGTYLGLYVFDRWGNCIACDDMTDTRASRDDLAVEWFPPEAGTYTVDVRNFGPSNNRFTLVLR